MAFKILTTKGFKEFKNAINRNPAVVINETKVFLQRGIAVYQRIINRDPWKKGQSGGGSPVLFGVLRGSHRTKFNKFKASIEPNANYAKFVHDGTYKMKARPWLDYAMEKGDNDINKLASDLLDNVTKDLSK